MAKFFDDAALRNMQEFFDEVEEEKERFSEMIEATSEHSQKQLLRHMRVGRIRIQMLGIYVKYIMGVTNRLEEMLEGLPTQKEYSKLQNDFEKMRDDAVPALKELQKRLAESKAQDKRSNGVYG